MSEKAKHERDEPELRFPEFEGAWETHRLDEIASIARGKFSARPRNDPKFFGGDIPFIQTGDIASSARKLTKFTQTLNQSGLSVSKLFPKNTILMTIAANIGDVAITDFSIACPDSVVAINCYESTDTSYLFDCLSLKKNELESFATTNAQANINLQILNPLKVKTPPLPEQEKIASFLSAVDEKIAQLEEKKKLLEDYKKGCMQQLFSQALRFKDEDGNDFPNWEEKRLGDVLEIHLRECSKPKNNYLAIGVRSHMRGTFQKPDSNPNKIAMEKLFQVQENDLIVNITFAWEGAIAIIRPEDDGGFVSHRFPTYRCKEKHLILGYIAQIILTKKLKFYLDLISPGGAGRNRVLSKKEFMKLKWSFPIIGEQQKIADFLSALDDKITHATEQLEQTKSFKKGLLQKMFV